MTGNLFTSKFTEKTGFVLGYSSAFIVDKFVKVTAGYKVYKRISYIAEKTKITYISATELFERSVDGVTDAF